MESTNWIVIAEQAETAKHEHLHMSKRFALSGFPEAAQGEFEHFRERKRGERFARRKIAL